MTELSATIRLRPTRIGFLVRPTDLSAVRKIMRCCACVWGGLYNPIIPVFRSPPKHWKPEPFEQITGLAVAKGYLNFFEPDVYVESEPGLLEQAGLAALRKERTMHPHVVSLNEFMTRRDHRDWSEPAFGLNIRDVLEHIYRTEKQFQPRDKKASLLVNPERNSALVEAVFGTYPTQKHAAYIGAAYANVFKPTPMAPSPDAWLKVFKEGADTALRVTRYGLDLQRFWHHDLVIFVFDPARH